MFSAEFGTAASNLELSSARELPGIHSYEAVIIGALPLTTGADFGVNGVPRYSDLIMTHANPGFSYGLGGTFWGENYVLGGYLGVAVASFLVALLLLFFQLHDLQELSFVYLLRV